MLSEFILWQFVLLRELLVLSSGQLNIVDNVEFTELSRGTEMDPARIPHIFRQIFEKIQNLQNQPQI